MKCLYFPQTTWATAVAQLEIDPRFTESSLPHNQQMHIFNLHITQLRAKHLDNLHALFASRSSSLATTFDDLPLSSLLTSLPVTKLGLDERDLRDEYSRWQRERQTNARRAFDQMLGENAFVEFWGRLAKMGGEGVDGGVKADEEGEEDEGTGGGGKADMKALAKTIDLQEMQKVLRNDQRYTVFEHVPEVREQWLRVSRFRYSELLSCSRAEPRITYLSCQPLSYLYMLLDIQVMWLCRFVMLHVLQWKMLYRPIETSED
jgi:heat shock protein beta